MYDMIKLQYFMRKMKERHKFLLSIFLMISGNMPITMNINAISVDNNAQRNCYK